MTKEAKLGHGGRMRRGKDRSAFSEWALCKCEGQLQPEGSPHPAPQAFFCLCISWGTACLGSPSRILAAGP